MTKDPHQNGLSHHQSHVPSHLGSCHQSSSQHPLCSPTSRVPPPPGPLLIRQATQSHPRDTKMNPRPIHVDPSCGFDGNQGSTW